MSNDRQTTLTVKGRDKASKELRNIKNALEELEASQNAVAAVSSKTSSALSEVAVAANTLNERITALKALKDGIQRLDELAASAQRAGREQERAAQRMVAIQRASDQYAAELKSLNAEYEKAQAAEAQLAARRKELGRQTKANKTEVLALKQEQAAAKDETRQAAEAVRAMEKALRDTAREQKRAAADQARAGREVAQTGAAYKELSATVQQASRRLGVRPDTTGVQQARQAYEEARVAASKLNRELAQSANPTAEMSNAARQSAAAVRQAKAAWMEQARAQQIALGNTQALRAATIQATAATRASGSVLKNQERELRRVSVAADRASTSKRRLAQSNTAATDSSRRALSVYQRLRGELLAITAATVGFYQIYNQLGQVVGATVLLEGIESRLSVVTGGDLDAAARELRFIRQVSDELGFALGDTADEYSKFGVAARQANFSLEGSRQIFKGVLEASRSFKLGQEQTNGVLLALQQIISKGKVSSEELRRQMGDRLPGAFNIFANALGVTTAQLDEMLKKGEVFASEDVLVAFANELSRQAAPQLEAATQSMTAELGRFQTSVFNARNEVAEGGFADALTDLLRAFNNFASSEEGIQFFRNIGELAGFAVRALVPLIENLETIGPLVGTLAVAFAGARIGRFVKGVAAAASGLGRGAAALDLWAAGAMRSAKASTRATGALVSMGTKTKVAGGILRGLLVAARGLVAFLGGPWGVAFAVASTGALALWDAMRKGAREAERAQIQIKKSTAEIADAFADSGGDIEGFGASIGDGVVEGLRDQLSKVKPEAERLGDEINETINNAIARGRFTSSFGPLRFNEIIDRDAARQVRELTDRFEDGELSAEQFKNELNALAEATEDAQLREFVGEINSLASEFADAEEATRQAESALRLVEGTATEADQAILGVAGAADAAGASLADKAVDGANKFGEALSRLKAQIPEVAAEMQRLQEQADLQRLQESALSAARNSGLPGAEYIARQTGARAQQSLDTEQLQERIDALGLSVRVSAEAVADVMKSEALRLKAYRDLGGLPTVGYGSTRIQGRAVRMDDVLTEGQAFSELVNHIGRDFARIDKLITAPITDSMRDALASIEYNTGALSASDGLRKIIDPINRGDYAAAQQAILNFRPTVKGVRSEGLVRRRQREAAMFGAEGVDPAAAGGYRMQLQQTAQREAEREAEQARREAEREAERQKREAERQAEAQRLARESVQTNIQDADFEQSLQGRGLVEAETLRRIREEENRLKAVGLELDEASRVKIAQQVQAKYGAQEAEDALNAKKERGAQLEQRVTELQEQRKLLQEQLTLAEQSGDDAQVASIQTRLEGVNAELLTAVQNAKAFHDQLGGVAAENTSLRLQNVQQQLTNTATTASQAGTTINNSLVGGLSGAFTSLSKAIGQGENAFEAARTAFLKFASDFLVQIGQMIVKQTLLNALGGGSGGAAGGGGIGGFISGLFSLKHSGGIVGMSGRTKQAPLAAFANAARYHGGGIVGLGPKEVPIIAERNEEVLTTDDPRHRFNGGGSGKSGGSTVKIVNAVDGTDALDQALASSRGEEVVLNYVRRNPAAFKAALEG